MTFQYYLSMAPGTYKQT